MSKIPVYLLGLIVLIFVGGFVFFAISTPNIEQNEVILEVPTERLG